MAACQSLEEARMHAPRSHPLAGLIWDVQARRAMTGDGLVERAARSHYVLLGEVHDNPEHHRLQTDVLRRLLDHGIRPALAMEQFDTEHQAAIDKLQAEGGATAERVAEVGGFDRKGWKWAFYEPLVSLAVRERLPVLALNLSRPAARRIATEGPAALSPADRAELALDATWNAERNEKMQREIIAGHCGQVPGDLLPRLVSAQRARDATMADVLVRRATSGAVAILGRGHARRDIGVPAYLEQRMPSASTLIVGFTEVESGHDDANDYEEAGTFDILWFTLPANREDPCKGLSLPAAK